MRGSASMLVLAVVVLSTVLGAGVTRVGDAALRAARADALADVGALAAVAGGPSAASDVVTAEGGRLLRHAGGPSGRQVVVVELQGASGTAAAAPGP
jgi:hypothetical protein